VTRLSFIGMSGSGKSYWTRKLASAGFAAIGIDDRIERKLAKQLAAGGYQGIGGVAAWMGWPDQPHYRERELQYLVCEVESMREALDEMEHSTSENIVLDTTGSVVYTGNEVCRQMKQLTTVVYLAATAKEEEILISRYLSDPKPVLWGDQFSQNPGESPNAAVLRCYPQLIAQRKRLYERLADRIVHFSDLRGNCSDELSAHGFLEFLNTQTRTTG
jgi:shikimate kinase